MELDNYNYSHNKIKVVCNGCKNSRIIISAKKRFGVLVLTFECQKCKVWSERKMLFGNNKRDEK